MSPQKQISFINRCKVPGIGHADIAVACVLRFGGEAHPALFPAARYPALAAHGAACEALPVFQEIVQVLTPPSG
jgi:glutathione S-transferase